MKPHEETWSLNATTRTADIEFPDGHAAEVGELRVGDAREPSEQDLARARLAAQAPAMARILERLVGDAGVISALRQELGEATLDEMRAALRAAGVLP